MTEPEPNLMLLNYRLGVIEASIKALVLEVDDLKTEAAAVARTLEETKAHDVEEASKRSRRSSTVTTITVMVAGALLTGVIALIVGVLQTSH